jgi:uncharacterized protein YjiS (DUF1127 family)
MNIKQNLMKLRRPAMSVIVINPASPAFSLSALFRWRFSVSSSQGRLYRDLKDLPDHLLLDIGVDPRNVPVRGEGGIARPDLLYQELTAAALRTAAQS